MGKLKVLLAGQTGMFFATVVLWLRLNPLS